LREQATRKVVAGSKPGTVKEFSKATELNGKLAFSLDKKLMHLVLENDEEVLDKGKIISEALDHGFSMITPDAFFEQLVKNYSVAENIYGASFIRQATGYEPDYLEKNIRIPEFARMLKNKLKEQFTELKQSKLLEPDWSISDKGIELAALALFMEELDSLHSRGIGEKLIRESSIYGMKGDVRQFRKDRYRDIAVRSSVKRAVRRSHAQIEINDLMSFSRQAKGRCYFIYALDASGSMKGEKIRQCKKAGIALAYKAIEGQDLVGLIIFGSDVRTVVPPTDSFLDLVKEITSLRAAQETNIAGTLAESIKLFPQEDATKHLVLLTDALPTMGDDPEKETLEAVSSVRAAGITISVVGIGLDAKGRAFAERIAELGEGRLYLAKAIEELDQIVLEDYAATTEAF